MTAADAVVERLLATSAVTALVASRIWRIKLPQRATYPAIRVQLISNPEGKHLRGPHGATRSRVQVDVYEAEASAGNPLVRVTNISEAVNDALVFEPFSTSELRVIMAERLDTDERHEAEEQNLVRMFNDFYVWSKPVN